MSWIREQKFAFQESGSHALLAWLRHRLRLDREYPRNGVVTVYFDTPSLDFYYQKVDGDYRKAKVRLRWYESESTGGHIPGDPPEAAASRKISCFLELKERCGALRRKSRIDLALNEDYLKIDPLHNRTVRELPRRLFELGFPMPGLLFPVLELRYNRYRFVDGESGTRVALDTDIRCTRVNSQWLPPVAPVRLPSGVLELKGNCRRPARALIRLGSRLTPGSFSKYGHCCDALMQPIAVRN